MHTRQGKHNNRKGFALITALLFSSILLIIALAYVLRVATEYRLMGKIYNATVALDLAEAGVERSLWELAYNNSTFSGWGVATDAGGNKTYTISVNAFQNYAGRAIGDYDVSVLAAADGMSATVTCAAYVPSRSAPDERKIIKVTYVRNNFRMGVVGLSGITMSGQAKTDSYDSSLGAYDSDPNSPTYNCSQNGSIASNGPISLSGQSYVNGNANPGPGYPFSSTPNVSGSYGTLSAPISVVPIPSSTVIAAQISNSNSNITITHNGVTSPYTGGVGLSVSSSDTVTLPGGTYYFTSISISGQARISITGPAIIYVDGGNVSVSGQGIVNAGQPSNLQLYSTGSSINLSGQSAFSGAIYAPNSTVTLTGQDNLYGSIICGSNVDSGQAKIHYDQSLANVSPVFANGVTSWQELQQ